MLKKAGILTVGVTAGLLAVAPIASAGEAKDVKGDHESSHDHDHGKKDHHGKKHHGDDGDQKGTGNIKCGASSDFDGSQENGDTQLGASSLIGPTASGNAGQLLSCNSFLNDNLNDLSVNILSEQAL